jgi:hypothetical protein
MADSSRKMSGFQGSERTGVEVNFYPQGGDPIAIEQEPFAPKGRTRWDSEPSIIAVSTQEQLGAPSGTWSITLKSGKRHHVREIFNDLIDDDWIDLSFFRHSRRWHVLRGLVDEINRNKQAGKGRGTATTWTISGRSFASIWEKTPIWFNVYSDENVSGSFSQRVFKSAENIIGNPAVAVEGYLRGMLEGLGDVGRSNWILPPAMPQARETFIDSVLINTKGYVDNLELFGINQNWLMPQGTVWSLAKEWSDPMFNELFCGMYPGGLSRPDIQIDPGKELEVQDSTMYAIFREKPFPTLALGRESPWFSLPIWVLPHQAVVNSTVSRNNSEHYNAFFVSPQLVQELLGSAGNDIVAALWNKDDIARHGLRRMDVVSKYTTKNPDLLGISKQQRVKVKDWYSLNRYFLNGTLQLGVGLPDIKLGTRVRILGPHGPDSDETYYVESVNHNWQFGVGLQTTLGVTRGWIGTDDSLMDALISVAGAYTDAVRALPKEHSVGVVA